MDKTKCKVMTNKIIVSGIVQGVGFRPLTFRVAKKNNIKGTVQNIGGMVEIIAQSSDEDFENFLYDLQHAECEGCEIINIEITDITSETTESFDQFKIIESTSNEVVSIIPPDLATCDTCLEELYKKDNRRYQNPFISCMSCGPRYTIMEVLPYDRDNTTMEDFPMCGECNAEYISPESRRFHAQTISCYDCGPYLIFKEYDRDRKNVKRDKLYRKKAVQCDPHKVNIYKNKIRFQRAVEVLKNGGILAVKGIGGYHFVCSPFMEHTVQNLRKLKGREEKPFAVMFESVEAIREYCDVSVPEKKLLESKARPIVLLYSHNEKMAPSTYKGSIYCGAFLPYTPLQTMLLRECGPLIMTSGNISDQPIIREDREMLSLRSPLLDGVLYNKRRIIRSVDDSVAKIVDGKAQLVRRSRGYVPYPVFLQESRNNLKIFAAGGDLKASFCLYNRGSAVVSQYFGDLEERSILEEYKKSVDDLSKLLKMEPDMAVCDLHPNYFSTRFTESLNKPILYVQHHHAHIASVMAEHNLKGKVIGIAFDGTGYGTDGNIWGSEFLICQGAEFQRAAHLKYAPMLGGDQSMKDAKKTADCFLVEAGLEQYIHDDRSDLIQAALRNHINTVLTSSMGRLFDAVSSILGILDENHYEGECAAYLEKEALLAEKSKIFPEPMSFKILRKDDMIEIDPAPVLEVLCRFREETDHTGASFLSRRQSLALGFHYALAEAIRNVCRLLREQHQVSTVAFSGGVFQNSVLTNRLIKQLRQDGFMVYYNIAVPPNDGSISLGQTYVGIMKAEQNESLNM
ncbi:carbamoyltransferase HypF [Aminipila luticellarii]|uniref:Carbamoyltransferase n=1 Tax=Aminipila luticellarii TaxID=2507160 RepID=A0A410PUU5_9FIRM|nr:carbamoyltransferase HypF [Aminipila luticellarii]QAT42684.1 carbamoyltransferase HypF [Aminipila luticellarii]